MNLYLILFKESLLYAIKSLILNRLRTLLSLLGITIGIFAIISVFTAIDTLEQKIRTSISSLGDNIVYVQKWPWAFGGEYPWWKYMKRPVVKYTELEDINRRSNKAEASCFLITPRKNIHYNENYAEDITIFCISKDYEKVANFEIYKGRFFSLTEMNNGRNDAVIGFNIAQRLFKNEDPLGKEIKIMGRLITVIGVFKKEGDDIFGMSLDDQVVLPIEYAKTIFNIRDERLNPFIIVKANKNVGVDELIDELRGIMRSVRKLKPLEDDNFALNKASMISQGFEGLFIILDITGIIIGGFSILVGGFGIANIMFVSVKEQTKIIGIQKAIGAKKRFILFQFLYESVILSLIGGIFGLLLIFGLSFLADYLWDLEIFMNFQNIVIGIIISIVTGVISGIIPAYKAARLNPVVAINQN